VKSEKEIETRLRKLRYRYLRQYLQDIRGRCYLNCKYNYKHTSSPISQKPGIYTSEFGAELVPHKQITLVVFQDDSDDVHLCVYGSEKLNTWSGDICMSNETAKVCPHFSPKVTEESAITKFNEAMADDAFVLTNMADLAMLQWVLGTRVSIIPLTIWERFLLWLSRIFTSRQEVVKALPPADLPEDIWNDPSEDS
jgi:hypothetical protein